MADSVLRIDTHGSQHARDWTIYQADRDITPFVRAIDFHASLDGDDVPVIRLTLRGVVNHLGDALAHRYPYDRSHGPQ